MAANGFNNGGKTPIIFFFGIFGCLPHTSINTNSYSKLCVVYTLLNRFATKPAERTEKKNT